MHQGVFLGLLLGISSLVSSTIIPTSRHEKSYFSPTIEGEREAHLFILGVCC